MEPRSQITASWVLSSSEALEQCGVAITQEGQSEPRIPCLAGILWTQHRHTITNGLFR